MGVAQVLARPAYWGTALLFVIFGAMVWLLGAMAPNDLHVMMDNDSAMRLVQVRDLLAGQPWRDLTQYRLGLGPEGTPMHWSRIVDLIIVAIITTAEAFTSTLGAERVAMLIWPALWFAVCLTAIVVSSHHLAGAQGAVYGFAGFFVANIMNWNFRAPNLDHHSIQMAMLCLSILGVIGRDRGAVYPTLAAAAIAVSLHIGAEIMPVMVVIIATYSLLFLLGRISARTMLAFTLSLAISNAVLFGFFVPFEAYRGGFCDAPSTDQIGPLLLFASLASAALALGGDKGWASRLILLGVPAAIGIGFSIGVYPACLSNPYKTIPERMFTFWLSQVVEAQPLPNYLSRATGPFPAMFWGIGLIALVAVLSLARRVERGADLVFLSIVVAMLMLFAYYQVRYLTFLMIITPLLIAYLAAQLKQTEATAPARRGGLWAVLLLVLAAPHPWIMLDRILRTQPAAPDLSLTRFEDCLRDPAFQRLADLPAGRVSATSNLGSHLLVHSPHSVLSAPYHRNVAGILRQIDISIAADLRVAEGLLNDSAVDYIVVCLVDPELAGLRPPGAETVWIQQLAAGEVALAQFEQVDATDTVFVFSRVAP